MTEELVEEALAQQEAAETQEVFTHNQDLLNLMTTLSEATLEQNPDAMVSDVVYLTVKSVLRNPAIRPTLVSVIPAIFAYYLEVYRIIVGKTKTPDVDDTAVLNEAALTLFDLYLESPHEHTLRRLLVIGARSIHEVVVAKLAQMEDLKIEEVMGRLSNIALFTETVNVYISSSKRKKNMGYITWLKTFFGRALSNPDLAFMEEDEEVKFVVRQLINNTKVIDTNLD